MSTRYTAKSGAGGKADLGYQEGQPVAGLDIPSCTIEDVDRSVFNLFENELIFKVKSNKTIVKVPVIFATGERFAILARKKPLRDKTGALILPLISIMRKGVTQNSGIGEVGPLVIKKKLAPEDAEYQVYANKQGLLNSDDVASKKNYQTDDGENEPGKKRSKDNAGVTTENNPQVVESIGANIYEIIEIPPVKHYTASYEIIFWCQYTQQMNTMMSVFMGGYTNNNVPSFRLETAKGYHFTGIVEADLSPDVNFDDFSDEERLVKCTINMKVMAYLVAPRGLGQPSPIRRYVSSPNISFTILEGDGTEAGQNSLKGVVDSNNPSAYVLENLSHELSDNQKQAVGGDLNKEFNINLDSLGSTTLNNNIGSLGTLKKIVVIDPITGKKKTIELRIADQNKKSGETVIRAKDSKGFTIKLEDLL